MLFVDGENFTKRGQDVMKDAGEGPVAGPSWRRDVFLWLPRRSATEPIFAPWHGSGGAEMATRAYYYTSTPSGEPEWTDTRLALRAKGFEPRLFPRRSGRSKAVDIALTTDVLTLGGEHRYDVAVIVAGDGDYVPLVEAVKRLGHHVVLAFFASSGLSADLRIAADEFYDLGPTLVDDWREWRSDQKRHEEYEKAELARRSSVGS
jgi:uncharacterized LabA/DUF88 family protein